MRHEKKHNPQNLLAGCRPAVEQTLREKDVNVGGVTKVNLRRNDRFQYQVPQGLTFRVTHPGGTESTFTVTPYDLSVGGIGFIHGAYVYPESRCSVDLLMPDGGYITAEGKVVRCSLIRSRVHDVGVAFDAPVRHGWYDSDQADAGGESDEASPPEFSGSVFLYTPSSNEADLMKHLLLRLGVEVAASTTVSGALFEARQSKHDLILVSVRDDKDDSGLAFVRELVQGDYPYPIVAVIGEGDAQAEASSKQAGCAGVVSRVHEYATLKALLRQYLTSREDSQPLFSTRWADLQLRPLIVHYLKNLEAQVRSIQKMLETGEPTEARQLCRDVRVTAEAYGYDPIAEEAKSLCALIGDTTDMQTMKPALSSMVTLASRASQAIA